MHIPMGTKVRIIENEMDIPVGTIGFVDELDGTTDEETLTYIAHEGDVDALWGSEFEVIRQAINEGDKVIILRNIISAPVGAIGTVVRVADSYPSIEVDGEEWPLSHSEFQVVHEDD
ncbi:hypothetical protein [Rhodococcus phage RGL3]|uniref:Uncharacterized protein n=1 Tax=Rhodococcus phage RGL3 TaxID=2922221 RepID=G9FHN3_9CAUD|nr:hypothetical protein RoPhRGL3_gp41 [Rhodococcus phage RGL3]AEV52121.1 hypothetical protein [Rhodococcus phage RGL3]